jgi:hypothetical protein
MHCTQRRNKENPPMSPDVPARPSLPPGPFPPDATQTAADLLGQVIAARDLDNPRCTPPAWLWHGYLGPGKVTLLTSQWKSGKTTLLSLLLARMQQGGLLAGLPVAAGKAFVISEESEAHWRPRFDRLGIHDDVHLLCRPFTVQPSMAQWLALLDTAQAMHQRHGSGLVVLDSFAAFLPPHSENNAGALLECMMPLQRLVTAGMSVFLLHHPRKGRTLAGQSARGSGALSGFVDILMEMGYYADPDDQDRRRRLLAFSRYDETPRHLLIELQPDGTDYSVRQTGPEAAGESWQGALSVLTEANSRLTRQEILHLWPAGTSKPEATTLWRCLNRMVAQGVVRQDGTGRPRAPFRYWLPEREAFLPPENRDAASLLQAWHDRCVADAVACLAGRTESLPSAASNALPEEPPVPAAIPGPATPAPEPLPLPVPETLAGTSPAPDHVPSPLAQPPTAPTAVRLPFPFDQMHPADVPEEVWRRARIEAEKRTS